MRRTLGVLTLLIASTLPFHSMALAQDDGRDASAELNDGALEAEIEADVATEEAGPLAETTNDEPLYPLLVRRVVDYSLNATCSIDGMVVGVAEYHYIAAPGAEPILATTQTECVTPPDTDDPPEPDTISTATIRAHITEALPLPRVAVNPAHGGLTGLDTWLWYDDDRTQPLHPVDHDTDPATPPRPGITVTLTTAGTTVTARAAITGYRWTVDTAGTTYSSTDPGSEQDPAATHVYTTKGTHPLTVETTWGGSWTATGGLGGTFAPITLTDTRDYPVHEITAEPAGTR